MNIVEKNIPQSLSVRFQANPVVPRPAGPRFSQTVRPAAGHGDQFVRSNQPEVQFAGTTRRNFLYTLVLGAGMFLAGCGGDGDDIIGPGPVEPTCTVAGGSQTPQAAQVLQENRASATQVIEQGIPLNLSQLEIPLEDNLRNCSMMVDPVAMQLQTVIENPVTGLPEERSVAVNDAYADGDRLVLTVEGPVSEGSILTLEPGAVVLDNGQEAQGTVHLGGGGLQDPQTAALWFKAYEPTNADLFPSSIYVNSPAQGIPQSTDPGTVFSELNAHYQNFLDLGLLTPEEVGGLLQRFQDGVQRQVFTDPQTGAFEPQLMAMVLATAGTPAEGLISTVVDGNNLTGRPARVVFADLPENEIAKTDILQDETGQDLWILLFNQRMRNEPFQVGSAIAGHEGMHQELDRGQDEEIIGKSVEINTWKQQLLANPELARLNTPLSRFLNLQLMMQENSGGAFPRGGLFEAPLQQEAQDVVPFSPALDPVSLEDFLVSRVYPDTPQQSTAGNAYLDAFVSWASGMVQQGLNFDRSVVETLDQAQFFTPEEDYEILRTLSLKPAESRQGTQFA